jgi:Arf-GAP with Rho-GAP domain, ANK repeat and PH domain-containing protein 1
MNLIEKIECYIELLCRLPEIEYQTLRKITGHLNFIQSQQHHNLMNAENLAMVWGVNILKDPQVERNEYSEEEKNVMHDLIVLYKDVFDPKAEELVRKYLFTHFDKFVYLPLHIF